MGSVRPIARLQRGNDAEQAGEKDTGQISRVDRIASRSGRPKIRSAGNLVNADPDGRQTGEAARKVVVVAAANRWANNVTLAIANHAARFVNPDHRGLIQ